MDSRSRASPASRNDGRVNQTETVSAAAHDAGNLPTARILEIADLILDQVVDRGGRDVADLAAWRDDARPIGAGALHGVGGRIVDQHAHAVDAALLHHTGAGLPGRTPLDAALPPLP